MSNEKLKKYVITFFINICKSFLNYSIPQYFRSLKRICKNVKFQNFFYLAVQRSRINLANYTRQAKSRS